MPSKTWSVSLVNIYTLATLWLAAPFAWSQTVVEKEAVGKAAITAYAANIESFTFYKCRYRHTRAQARTIEAAIRGDYINARFYDNRLIVDGERDLYEGLAPPPDPKQAKPIPGKKGGLVQGKRTSKFRPAKDLHR